MMNRIKTVVALAVSCFAVTNSQADDWPTYGRDSSRNLYTPAKNLPSSFVAGDMKAGTEDIDMGTTENIRWVAKLGSSAYGNPVVSNGRVFVGTNNESPRDPKFEGDHSMLFCLDEKTGEFLWQLGVPKLDAGKVSDWEFLGITSSPAVEGDRVYVLTSRNEIICLDFYGMENGNQGFQDEAAYMAGPGNGTVPVGEKDADIIWRFDMRTELGVFPHNATSGHILIYEDMLFAATSNGQDYSHLNIPAPFAPALVAVNKNTGEYMGEEMSGISEKLKHCNWSTPSVATINGKDLIIFGGGDGICYAFDPVAVEDEEEPDILVLPEIWRYDANPEPYKEFKYPHADGPSEIIAAPVVYKDRVYVAIGQDPEHGEGVGNLVCIDPSKTGDITADGAIWTYDKIHRSISTISIDPETNLLFIADYSGYVYCLDADTGEEYWIYDMKAHIWGSTLVGDGKVYIGDEDGDLVILPAKKDFDPENDDPIFETYFYSPVYSSPIEANGTIYVATQTHLYAIGGESNVPPTTDQAPRVE